MMGATDFMDRFMTKIKNATFDDLLNSDEGFIRNIVDKISTFF